MDKDKFGNPKSLLDAVKEAQKAGSLEPLGTVRVNYSKPEEKKSEPTE